jgi:hypothetical protein
MVMAKLSKKQRKQFYQIRREQGVDAAREYRQGIISGTGSGEGDWSPRKPKGALEGQWEYDQRYRDENLAMNRYGQTDAFGNVREWTQDPETGQWSLQDSLSPEQQQRWDQQMEHGGRIGDMQGNLLGQMEQQGPYDVMGNVSDASWGGFAPQNIQWGGFGNEVARPGGSGDFWGERQDIEEDLYGRYSQKLGREWERREDDERQRLADMGVSYGSEAFDRAMDDFRQREGYAYDDAMTKSIETGGVEQSRLFGMSGEARDRYTREQLQDVGAQMDIRNMYAGETQQDWQNRMGQQQQQAEMYNMQYNAPYQQYGMMQNMMPSMQGPNFGTPYDYTMAPPDVAGTSYAYTRNPPWRTTFDEWYNRADYGHYLGGLASGGFGGGGEGGEPPPYGGFGG